MANRGSKSKKITPTKKSGVTKETIAKHKARASATGRTKHGQFVKNPTGSKNTGRGHKYTKDTKTGRNTAAAQKIKHNQEMLILAYKKFFGNISRACAEVGLTRQTWGNYMREYPEFKQAAEDVIEHIHDEVESALHKNIFSGDTTAQIFYLKTRCKHRGYVERQEIVQSNVIRVGFDDTDNDDEK